MELVGVQMDIQWEDAAANCAAVSRTLEQSPPARGALVVLPEMFASGFSQNVNAAVAEAATTEQFLRDTATKYGIALMAGIAVRAGDCGANESVTFGPDGSELARYRKLQPFTGLGEERHYPAGDRVATFQWGGFTVAPFICYDLRFPEVFRAAVRKGADLIAVVASWPDPRHHHWTTLLKARAIENLAAVIGVNRAGTDPMFHYAGGSLILGPQAEILAEAGDAPGCLRAVISPDTVAAWRGKFPALRDRRKDYAEL